jgi:hypothetical protein
MATRNLVFRPLALRQRSSFVNSWHKAALAVLEALDDLTGHHPEGGMETTNKGRFIINASVTFQTETFICSVVYAYNRQAVSWEAFTWQAVNTPPKPKIN